VKMRLLNVNANQDLCGIS